MAVNQLKALFEQQGGSGGENMLPMKKSQSLPRMQKNNTAAPAERIGIPQLRQGNKLPVAQTKEAPGIRTSTPSHTKGSSTLPRSVENGASPLHMAHRARSQGISGEVTRDHKPSRLNNSRGRPNSADGSGALQRSGSAESLTSSNDSDDRGRDRLSRRTSSEEDLSPKMAAVESDTPPWGKPVLKKAVVVVSTAVDVSSNTEDTTIPPAEYGKYLLEARKGLRKTVASTSTPPQSPLPDEVGGSTRLVDDAPELGSVGFRIGKYESQIGSSVPQSEQNDENDEIGSFVSQSEQNDSDGSSEGAGPEESLPLQKGRGSVDSPSPLTGAGENGSPELSPPDNGEDACGVSRESESVASTPASSGPPDAAKIEKDRKRRQNIAQELLETEKSYCNRLELISVKFYDAVTQFNAANKQLLPEASIQQIFLNIQQIHALSQNILAELQMRMDNWSTREQLGDVLCRLAPFLKLYSTYTAGFEGAMKTLTEWTSKDKKFDALVKNFDRELGTGLGITSYMLEPIQRIPRYRLLLTDYVKHLPEDSPERTASEKALGIISEAADKSNDRFKELESCNEILSIQRSLQDYEDTLLAPGRFFLRRGLLSKESHKKGASRHMFFLFSDIFLCTVPQSMHSFKLKYELQLKDMIIEDMKAAIIPHAFAVKCITKSFVLGGSCEEEKQEWMAALNHAIQENRKRNSSLRRESRLFKEKNPRKLGSMAPIMVNDKSVSMCQLCKVAFTITFRRHHCRACGKVVCGSCLLTKAYLEYLKREDKICFECSQLLNKVKYSVPPSHEKHDGVLDVKGYEDDAILATYVLLQEGKKWNKVWFQLKDDLVLYKFAGHEDVKALDSKPLLGYSVFPEPSTSQIRLVHPSNRKDLCETFKLDNQVDFDHWVEALQKAVQMEDFVICNSPVQPSVEPQTAATS